MRHARLTGIAGLVLVSALPAHAQVLAGPQFRVNSFTDNPQDYPSVAMAPSGAFVVMFTNYVLGPLNTMAWARFYDARSNPAGPDFAIDFGYVRRGSAAFLRNGDAALAWEFPSLSPHDVAVRRFRPPDTAVGPLFVANSYTTGSQGLAQVVAQPDGGFTVVWNGVGASETADAGVWARRFSLSGPSSADERVNTYTTGNQFFPSAAALPGGGYVVVWMSDDQEGGNGRGIFGQRFGAGGAPLGTEFHVNSYVTGNQELPSVAAEPSGRFVVAWNSANQDGSGPGVFGQRYDAQGAPAGLEFAVNTQTTGTQILFGVAADAAGNFIVTFRDGNAVMGRRYWSDGSPRGAEFQVAGAQSATYGSGHLGMDPAGNFVIAWPGPGAGDPSGVFGQRFGGLRPMGWSLQEGGNGVFEPGETASVTTSWRNDNGQAQTFQGTATFTGPPGATYDVLDGSADYGTVADGTTVSCAVIGDCFSVAVSVPPQRPVVHWDPVLHERIVPDAHGQVSEMALHVGDSFDDVPRSSPYYRFVETLLHRGVTGGCAATTYCPAASATREQMSAFVLVAKEGAGYAPPACAAPMFNDVPASSPFCRWIEELARRGVVTGCGGGNYCPGDPVSREQMAVFVLRTLEPALDPPACVSGSEMFADVPASSAFCRWIEELARRGVVTGCGGGNYCPGDPVTREQMGVFLTGTFGLTLYGP